MTDFKHANKPPCPPDLAPPVAPPKVYAGDTSVTFAARRREREPVTIEGKILYVSEKALKLWTPIKDEWIPLSWIFNPLNPSTLEPLNLAQLREGDAVIFEIPAWLAREKGLVE